MPIVRTAFGDMSFCVLIPSCGRSDRWRKNASRMSFLDHEDTFLGIHHTEQEAYDWAFGRFHQWKQIVYPNPLGSVAVAREVLRQQAIASGGYDYYVVTDDNATYTRESLSHLVRACHEYRRGKGALCTMAGMHNTAPHFDRRLIQQTALPCYGLTTYANVAMIFQCYPHQLYSKYTYPPDAYGLDDRHFYLWCINRGVRDFRVCMEARFNKARYQEGGQGDIRDRARKNGLAIARLATDFPDLVGAAGTLRIPWQLILQLKAGATVDRLAGGAMRKEDALGSRTATAKVRKRKETA